MAEAPPIYRFTSRLLPTCSIGSPQCFGHRRRSEYASAAAIHVRSRALSTEPRDSVLVSYGLSQSDRSLAYFRPPCRLAMSAQRFSLSSTSSMSSPSPPIWHVPRSGRFIDALALAQAGRAPGCLHPPYAFHPILRSWRLPLPGHAPPCDNVSVADPRRSSSGTCLPCTSVSDRS